MHETNNLYLPWTFHWKEAASLSALGLKHAGNGLSQACHTNMGGTVGQNTHVGGAPAACPGSCLPWLLSKPGWSLALPAKDGETLPVVAKLQWPCCDTVARAAAEQPATAQILPFTMAALIIQIPWVINICHHLKGILLLLVRIRKKLLLISDASCWYKFLCVDAN